MLRFSKHARDTWQNLRNGELRERRAVQDQLSPTGAAV
jgi:hypothetical protein